MITIPAENKQNMKEGKVDMDLTVLLSHEEIKVRQFLNLGGGFPLLALLDIRTGPFGTYFGLFTFGFSSFSASSAGGFNAMASISCSRFLTTSPDGCGVGGVCEFSDKSLPESPGPVGVSKNSSSVSDLGDRGLISVIWLGN